jgi:predicted Zn-dependent protease|tara:strand:+ start:885 stop:1823 length:939 start_codon:yes stop_codon:yes gene_type:complete
MRTTFAVLILVMVLLNACSKTEEGKVSQSGPLDQPKLRTKPKQAEIPVAFLALNDDKKPKQDDLIGNLFRLGSSLAKSADEIGQEIFGLSAKEQKEIGERLHKKLKSKHGLQEDSAQLARIKRLAAPFQKQMKRKGMKLSFHILDLDEVNAFSHVGGYIYLNKGFLKIIETDEELQFVIGHEIAHLDLGHCEKLLTYAVRAKDLGDELGGALGAEAAESIAAVAYEALSAGYSEEQELDCDAWSYRAMRKDGCPHKDCIAMTQKFLEREKAESKTDTGKSDDSIDQLATEVDNHFRTHPPAKKRLETLEKLK